MRLDENEIHLWLTDLNAVDGELLPAYRSLMTGEELERNRRYRFERHRFADCVTRALVRTVLSRYADVTPDAWRFARGDHGKPEIAVPEPELPFRFNLSHSRRYVVCAVGLRRDLGVDIECTERRNALPEIAERYFAPSEVEALFALPENRRNARFFDYWTLKEAYMKASGEGIALGLANFSFDLSDSVNIRIGFTSAIDESPGDWRFRLFSPARDHRLAVARRTGGGETFTLRLFETVPLRNNFSERPLE